MGNSSDKKKAQDLVFLKTLTLNYERQKDRTEKEKKDFNTFKNYMLEYEYYRKILQLGCKKNPVLKLLYLPESSLNNYNLQMFDILEDIYYANYTECLQLLEMRYSHTLFQKKSKDIKFQNEKTKIIFDFLNVNDIQKPKKGKTISQKNSFRNSSMRRSKRSISFTLAKDAFFNKSSRLSKEKNQTLKSINKQVKTFNEGLLELMEKICLYDTKKIQKILLVYPINNMRWIIWLAMAKHKYRKIDEKMRISNKEIYNDLVKNVDLNDDSLLFELHNTLKEVKVYKYNWSNSLYRIIKSLTQFEQNLRYENGMNFLIGVPLLISDCNEEETFFFGRFLLSISFGLGLYYFYDENEILLRYLVFIFHHIAKEKFPKIYDKISEFNIADELWIKKWYKTFFSSIFDLSITIRVWDCIIGVGIKFLVNYSLAILEYFEEKIMSFKKVKEFLEFFDYDLKKKFTKDNDIILFRENIISLAQSYYIPDGKYKLLEKEYLNLLFLEKEKSSGPSFNIDTSKTIHNYYSNNESLNNDQYNLKLILRTIVYTPSELITNNVEEQNISIYENKKLKKLNNNINSISSFKEEDENTLIKKQKSNLKNKEDNRDFISLEEIKIISSLKENQEKKMQSDPCLIDVKNILSKESISKLSSDKKEGKNNEAITKTNEKKDLIDIYENKNLIETNDLKLNDGEIKDKNGKNNNLSGEDDVIDDDSFDFTFNEEQVPTT